MTPRRAQAPISFRSDKAAARLRLLTCDGRSQAEVIEEALEQLPEPKNPSSVDEIRAAIREITAITSKRYPPIPSMAEFDAMEYDENGNCR